MNPTSPFDQPYIPVPVVVNPAIQNTLITLQTLLAYSKGRFQILNFQYSNADRSRFDQAGEESLVKLASEMNAESAIQRSLGDFQRIVRDWALNDMQFQYLKMQGPTFPAIPQEIGIYLEQFKASVASNSFLIGA